MTPSRENPWHRDPIDVAALTSSQPFCAGTLIMHSGGILITLNADHVPPAWAGTAWRVGGVGGGQEPGETVWQCAEREAAEELSVPAQLHPAPVTYIHDLDTDDIDQRRCADAVAAGAQVVGDAAVDPQRRLWLPPDETLAVLVPIVQRQPQLLAAL